MPAAKKRIKSNTQKKKIKALPTIGIGIQSIKGEFGMVMVQDPASAKYDGMPQSAMHRGGIANESEL